MKKPLLITGVILGSLILTAGVLFALTKIGLGLLAILIAVLIGNIGVGRNKTVFRLAILWIIADIMYALLR